jgi:DNA-binding GntR family transcriptional regulator
MNDDHPSQGKIERESITLLVYRHIKQKILSGAFPPNTHLLEMHIAEQMGISRSPVREAFRLLEADRMIEFRAHKGSFVRELTPKEVREIYTARRLIEGHVAGLAASGATSDDIEGLRLAMKRVNKAALDEDYENTLLADYEFHHQVWEISGHMMFCEILDRLQVQIRMFMIVQAPLFKDLYTSVMGHHKIFDAISQGDADVAKVNMELHITEAGVLALRCLQTQEEENLSDLTIRS